MEKCQYLLICLHFFQKMSFIYICGHRIVPAISVNKEYCDHKAISHSILTSRAPWEEQDGEK